MKMFLNFLKSIKNSIVIFLIFLCIFALSFALFHLPVRAVIYPVLLCAITGGIYLAADFMKYRKKCEALLNISKMTASMIDALPECEERFEAEYQNIISALRGENIISEENFSRKYRDMTEYYSVWAHQIKTPIASMKLTLQGEDSQTARKLSSELIRIEQYVEMVLAFIRLDSSSTDYVFREYEIDGIIKKSVRKFASDFIGKKIKLNYEPLDKKIITDEKWLSFVIEQLLSNSLKYTKEGFVRIYQTDDECLCIEDSGIGIAPEDLPRIFEKGYTGFNGRMDTSSSGIGLYLCKRVCDNLHLKISAESKLNEGTKIFVDLKQSSFRHE